MQSRIFVIILTITFAFSQDSEALLKMFNQKHKVSTGDSVLYNTSKDWEQAIRTLKMKFGGWFGYVYDSDYIK